MLGFKIKGKGKFSFDRLCKDQELFFKNFPVDASGRVHRLARFASMTENDLIVWLNHLLASFKETEDGEEPHPRPFRFLDRHRREPELAMVKMGPAADTTLTMAQKTGSKAGTKSSGRTKKRHQSVVTTTDEESEDSEASVPPPPPAKKKKETNARTKAKQDAEEFTPTKKASAAAPAPKASKGSRSASVAASTAISKQAKIEAAVILSAPKPKFATALSFTPKGKPGTPEGRGYAARHTEARKMIVISPGSNIQSMYLQHPGMKSSTLIGEWKTPGWNGEKVSFFRF